MTDTKKQAIQLLRKYDKMRKELREVERELAKAATAYGRELGYYGFSKDMLRIRLENEAEDKRRTAA